MVFMVYSLLFYHRCNTLLRFILHDMNKKSTKTHWQNYWQSHDHQSVVVHQDLIDNLQAVINVRGKKILEVGAG